jgi:hypothetical protein
VAASLIKGFPGLPDQQQERESHSGALDLLPKEPGSGRRSNAAERGFIKLMWDCRLQDKGKEYH